MESNLNEQETKTATTGAATMKEAEVIPRYERQWQNRLLPFMKWMMGMLAIFFLAASLFQIVMLDRRLGTIPDIPSLVSSVLTLEKNIESVTVQSEETRARIILEAHALQRRYHQANALLLTRIWTRHIGFLTGMILALLGATFILGKLREPSSALGGEYENTKVSFASASPGLFLTLFGTAILLCSLFATSTIEVTDTPVYLRSEILHERSSLPAPEVLDSAETGGIKLKEGKASE